ARPARCDRTRARDVLAYAVDPPHAAWPRSRRTSRWGALPRAIALRVRRPRASATRAPAGRELRRVPGLGLGGGRFRGLRAEIEELVETGGEKGAGRGTGPVDPPARPRVAGELGPE